MLFSVDPADLSGLCLKGRVWIKETNRQETEHKVGRASNEYCDQP